MSDAEDPPPSPSEEERFERCFCAGYASVLAFAIRRLPEWGAAEDAAAETFAVAWRRRELIPEEPLPWLYAIALRVIANQRRSSERRHRLTDRLAHEAGAGTSPPEPLEAIARRDAFAHAFRHLDEDEREVLRLIAWDGLDTRDAARVLGCSTGAFRVRLHRARRKLAKQLAAAGHSPNEHPARASHPAEEPS